MCALPVGVATSAMYTVLCLILWSTLHDAGMQEYRRRTNRAERRKAAKADDGTGEALREAAEEAEFERAKVNADSIVQSMFLIGSAGCVESVLACKDSVICSHLASACAPAASGWALCKG